MVADLWAEHPDRWAAYAEAALGRGARAVFTFPLPIAAVDLGALDLYRLQPGLLTREQTDDVLILADIAARSMLAQPNKIHVDGSVNAENWQERSRSAPAGPGRAVDLGSTVGQALAPLRQDAITDVLDPR